jgi:oligopeptidase A
MTVDNPLLATDGLPAFEQILPEHVEPAVDAVLAANRARIEDIVGRNDIDFPSFAGELEEIGDRLSKVWSPVSHLNGVKNSDALRDAYNRCLPKLTEYWTQMGQDARLCAGYKALEARTDLTEEERRVVEHALRDFRLAGVDLASPKRERFAAIALDLSRIGAKFSENVLDATKAWKKRVTAADLRGMPDMAIESAREAASSRGEEGLLLTLDLPSYLAVMAHAETRELRREMYEAYMTRASEVGPNAGQFDNAPLIRELLALRREQAQLLGFESYASYSLVTKMADTPERVLGFLYELADRSLPSARRDLEELNDFARSELGLPEVTSWDAAFASEHLRRARYDISKEALRPYFPIERVLQGLFTIATRLFDIEIAEVHGWQRWHDSVRCFDVRRGGELVGRFYLDAFARENKRGGAWMDECRVRRETTAGLQLPVAHLVCNFAPPVGGRPALMTHDEVNTLFHEFGHGLHHLLTRVSRAPLSGINGVPWDAVELPSQFMENWCWDRESIGLLSAHWETGEPLPSLLLDRMLAAKNFQSAMFMVRQLEFGLFDMRIHHEDPAGDPGFVRRVLQEVRQRVAVLMPPPIARFENSFGHIFSGGYAAGYYSYKWAEVLSADAFSAFEEEGVFSREAGARFRSAILERGGVVDPEAAFVAFRGRAPEQTALLRHAGILR